MKDADVELSRPPLSLTFPAVASAARQRAADYVSLAKPRLNFLVVVTAMVGYQLGLRGRVDLRNLMEALVGTALVAGGASGLNQVYERDTDGLMWRTRTRPLPDRRLSPADATIFSVTLAVIGVVLLAAGANLLAAAVALGTLVSYIAVYTPLKRRSSLATLVGAVPGALPPMIGWAAARGSLSIEGWALVAIVFCWQIPHFYAIAWMYRDDYLRAGFPLLPVVEPDGRRTGRQAVLFASALVPVSLLPFLLHVAGPWYGAGAAVLSFGLLGLAIRFAVRRTTSRARQLFLGSITYLPLLWGLLIADRIRL